MFPFISSGVRIFIQIIVWSDDTIWPDLRARHHKNPSLLSQQQIEINTSDWSNVDKTGFWLAHKVSMKIDIGEVGHTKIGNQAIWVFRVLRFSADMSINECQLYQ